MSDFRSKFTRIQDGFSRNRRIPRLGRIRLGVKVQKLHNGQPVLRDGRPIEYPKETEHFVVPEEVARVYGDRPTELDVMFFSNDPEVIFPQSLVWYGSGKGVKCRGNGVEAERYNEPSKTWVPRACPCEQRKTAENPRGECDEVGHLLVTLPKVNVGGVYQIDTRSYNSTVDVNSGIDMVRLLLATQEHPEGRIAMVPLRLRREKRETHHDGKKQIHFTMSLTLDADIAGLNKLREDTKRILQTARFQIEGPTEENPAFEPPDTQAEDEPEDAEVVSAKTFEAETLAAMTDQQIEALTNERREPAQGDGAARPPSHSSPSTAAPTEVSLDPTITDHRWADFKVYCGDDADRNDAMKRVLTKTFRVLKLDDLAIASRNGFILSVQDAWKKKGLVFEAFAE